MLSRILERPMAVSRELTNFLQNNLSKVTVPSSYDSLLEKLMNTRPARTPPAIKQSPENSLRIDNSETK
jgi:hypothetical protein